MELTNKQEPEMTVKNTLPQVQEKTKEKEKDLVFNSPVITNKEGGNYIDQTAPSLKEVLLNNLDEMSINKLSKDTVNFLAGRYVFGAFDDNLKATSQELKRNGLHENSIKHLFERTYGDLNQEQIKKIKDGSEIEKLSSNLAQKVTVTQSLGKSFDLEDLKEIEKSVAGLRKALLGDKAQENRKQFMAFLGDTKAIVESHSKALMMFLVEVKDHAGTLGKEAVEKIKSFGQLEEYGKLFTSAKDSPKAFMKGQLLYEDHKETLKKEMMEKHDISNPTDILVRLYANEKALNEDAPKNKG